MATEIRVPTLGESVTEATIGKWFKKPGDAVKADEPLVELETDKVTLEVNAPAAGVLAEIAVKDGETVGVGALLGSIAQGGAGAAAPPPPQGRRAGAGSRAGPAAAPAPAAGQAPPAGTPHGSRRRSASPPRTGVDPAGSPAPARTAA